MVTSEYDKKTQSLFRGVFARGLADNTPEDHGTDCRNMKFNAKGECQTRDGVQASLATLNHPVKRLCVASFNGGTLVPLTLDDNFNLYSGVNPTPILTVTNMVDFVILNLFNKCFIAPILSTGTTTIRVWDGTNPVRNAAGAAPTAGGILIAADGAAGNVDAGNHNLAVVYITSTGFKTQPGPKIAGVFSPTTYTAPGSKKINISSIPTGPTGTVARQILATKAGLLQYFIVPGGLINDNTSTTVTVDFFDSDLTVDASYLFDLLESLQVGTASGLDKYHGSMMYFGGEGCLVRVSLPGDPESFNNVNGFIQIPDENDGNNVFGSFVLRDILYFTKFPGIFSVSVVDAADPSSWVPIQIEGGVGAIGYGISTISATQTHLTARDLVLLADLNGLTIFDGAVETPILTWKIDATWTGFVTIATASKITVCIDPFEENIYFYISGVNFIFVGNFSEGLSADAIKWSYWNIAATTIKSIAVSTYQDSEIAYRLRIGFSGVNALYKLDPNSSDDGGNPITSYWQTPLFKFEEGLNVFAAVRLRIQSKVEPPTGNTVALVGYKENLLVSQALGPSLAITIVPSQEYFRQINFTGEKMALRITNLTASGFVIQRIDVYGKQLFQTRPG